VAALDAFIAHSDAHFSDENARMEATTFPPSHCHVTEHANVLGLCREVRQMVLDGKLEVGRVLARELAPWFRNHAATMDRMLAYWLTLDEAGRLEALRQGAEATRAAQAAGQVANCSAGTACSEHGHPQSDTVGA
jgi:hemerythrin